jgi:hypothetical protein
MKSTHWSVSDNPERWIDYPATSPAMAAKHFICANADESWNTRDDLINTGTVDVPVMGWIETAALLDPEVAFDGYDPGDTYFAPTGETQYVRISITYEELEP